VHLSTKYMLAAHICILIHACTRCITRCANRDAGEFVVCPSCVPSEWEHWQSTFDPKLKRDASCADSAMYTFRQMLPRNGISYVMTSYYFSISFISRTCSVADIHFCVPLVISSISDCICHKSEFQSLQIQMMHSEGTSDVFCICMRLFTFYSISKQLRYYRNHGFSLPLHYDCV
jgi:hypothetical protein